MVTALGRFCRALGPPRMAVEDAPVGWSRDLDAEAQTWVEEGALAIVLVPEGQDEAAPPE